MDIEEKKEKLYTDIPEFILKKMEDIDVLYSREEIRLFKNGIKDYHFLMPVEYSNIIKGLNGDYSGFYKLETYMQNLIASDFYYKNYDLWIEQLDITKYDVQSPVFKRMIKLSLGTTIEKERMLPFVNTLDRLLIGKDVLIDLYSMSINKILEDSFSPDGYLVAFNIIPEYNEIVRQINDIFDDFKRTDATILSVDDSDMYKEKFVALYDHLSQYLNDNWDYRNLRFRFAYISKECLEMIIKIYDTSLGIVEIMKSMKFDRIDNMNKKLVKIYYDNKHELYNQINYAFKIMSDKAKNYKYKMDLINSALIKPNSKYFITVENSLNKVAEFIKGSKDMTRISEANEFLFLLLELSESCTEYIEYKDKQFLENDTKDKRRSIKGFRRYTMSEAINCYCKNCIKITKTYIKLISDIDFIEKNGKGNLVK